MCDTCKGAKLTKTIELEKYADCIRKGLAQAEAMKSRLTGLKLVTILTKKCATNLRVKDWNESVPKWMAEHVVTFLLLEGFLKEEFSFTAYTTLSYLEMGPLAMKLRTQEMTIPMLESDTKKKRKSKEPQPSSSRKIMRKNIFQLICDDSE